MPLARDFAQMDTLQKAVNIASFIGQGTVRSAVVGSENRKPTAEEIRKMVDPVKQGMKDGALGISGASSTCPARSPRPKKSSSSRKPPRATAASTSHISATT